MPLKRSRRLYRTRLPTKSASKQAGEIVLRQITRMEDIKAISLPDELTQALADSRTFVREGAVVQLEKLLHGNNLGWRLAKEALEKMAAEDDSYRVRQVAACALALFAEAPHETKEERPDALETASSLRQEIRQERLVSERVDVNDTWPAATSGERAAKVPPRRLIMGGIGFLIVLVVIAVAAPFLITEGQRTTSPTPLWHLSRALHQPCRQCPSRVPSQRRLLHCPSRLLCKPHQLCPALSLSAGIW